MAVDVHSISIMVITFLRHVVYLSRFQKRQYGYLIIQWSKRLNNMIAKLSHNLLLFLQDEVLTRFLIKW